MGDSVNQGREERDSSKGERHALSQPDESVVGWVVAYMWYAKGRKGYWVPEVAGLTVDNGGDDSV